MYTNMMWQALYVKHAGFVNTEYNILNVVLLAILLYNTANYYVMNLDNTCSSY